MRDSIVGPIPLGPEDVGLVSGVGVSWQLFHFPKESWSSAVPDPASQQPSETRMSSVNDVELLILLTVLENEYKPRKKQDTLNLMVKITLTLLKLNEAEKKRKIKYLPICEKTKQERPCSKCSKNKI